MCDVLRILIKRFDEIKDKIKLKKVIPELMQ